MSDLAPVPSENSTCANCSAPLVADQRYCLACGQPVSPVRLAFLDVLDAERKPQTPAGVVSSVPLAYSPYLEPAPGPAWLRRFAPLFSVAAVALLAMLVGLLLGHWVSQSKSAAAPQVIKIEGLSGAPVAALPTTPSTVSSTPATPTAAGKSSASTKSEEEREKAEARAEEKEEEKAPAKAPPAKKLSTQALTKLEKTTGRKKEAELNKITTAPIEVK